MNLPQLSVGITRILMDGPADLDHLVATFPQDSQERIEYVLTQLKDYGAITENEDGQYMNVPIMARDPRPDLVITVGELLDFLLTQDAESIVGLAGSRQRLLGHTPGYLPESNNQKIVLLAFGEVTV